MPNEIEKQSIGFAFETVTGTPVTVTDFAPFTSVSLKGRYGRQEDTSHRFGQFGRRVDQVDTYADGAEGGFAGLVPSKGFVMNLLELFMGGAPTSTPNTPVAGYTRRTFTKGALAKTATFQKIVPREGANDTFTYPGCVGQTLTLSGGVNTYLGFQAALLGREERDNIAAATPSYTGLGSPFRTAAGSGASAALALTVSDGASTVFTVCYEAYELVINNNYTEQAVWCGRDIEVNQPPTLSLRLRNGLYAKTWWAAMIANSTLSVVLTHQMVGDVNTTFKVTLPACKARTALPDQSSQNLRVRQDIELEALVPLSGSMITVETTATT
jgi:hypothetical protein